MSKVKFAVAFNKKIIQQSPYFTQALGGAVSDIVTANHSTEAPVTSSGTATGTITSSPKNKTILLHSASRVPITHDPGTGAREVFARLTEALGVWTLSYYYFSDLGVQTAYSLPFDNYDYYYARRTNLKPAEEDFGIAPQWRSAP